MSRWVLYLCIAKYDAACQIQVYRMVNWHVHNFGSFVSRKNAFSDFKLKKKLKYKQVFAFFVYRYINIAKWKYYGTIVSKSDKRFKNVCVYICYIKWFQRASYNFTPQQG